MWPSFFESLQRHPLATGLLGTVSSIGASSLTFFEQLDLFNRVAGGLLGVAIGVVTLLVQIRNLRRKKSDDETSFS